MKNKGIKKTNILLTAFIICISLIVVSLVYVPRIIGYKTYTIETGSMEPTINTGSLVYVNNNISFKEYEVGDIVTFSDREGTKSFTHRIVKINTVNQSFETKGDANKVKDAQPTDAMFAVGRVELVIPYLGYAATFLKNPISKIAVALIYVAWAAIEIELFNTERKRKVE